MAVSGLSRETINLSDGKPAHHRERFDGTPLSVPTKNYYGSGDFKCRETKRENVEWNSHFRPEPRRHGVGEFVPPSFRETRGRHGLAGLRIPLGSNPCGAQIGK
jgi:hypothetical protein